MKRGCEYKGNNERLEATLKREFADAGCDTQQLTEQPAKGAKLPNVICTLPGETETVIIVGAHFDHLEQGDGVVDNWSGASLLPSLYESLKNTPRNTPVFSLNLQMKRKAKWVRIFTPSR